MVPGEQPMLSDPRDTEINNIQPKKIMSPTMTETVSSEFRKSTAIILPLMSKSDRWGSNTGKWLQPP
jgi:hypothetical protein